MTIPAVIQGTVEVEGKVFELDSPKGAAWLETIGSFRFEPAGNSKPYTVRREPSGYWYGCRKISGKVRKKYIGKSSEVSLAKLEEIAAALEVPPVPRVNKVAEVAQEVTQDTQVAEKVAEVAEDRLTALELEVANLRKALEAIQEALPGKSEAGDSTELPKIDNAVAEELQNELSNLKADNEKLRADYDALLESSTVVTKKLDQEVQKLRSQLETEKTRGEEIWEELTDTEQALAEVRSENSELKKTCAELRSQLDKERADREEVEAELSDLKQKSAAAGKNLPEAAEILNQLKTKRKKSTTTLADVEKILEILEGT
jgi:chromosome segregation ATPase